MEKQLGTPIPPSWILRDKKRLIQFYQGLGFIFNRGRNRDFRINEMMLFPPPPSRRNPLDPELRILERVLPTGSALDHLRYFNYLVVTDNLDRLLLLEPSTRLLVYQA